MTVCPHSVDPVPTFNQVFGYQPVVSVILSQPSRYKIAESNLLADEKGPQHWIQVFVWVIHLYFYIYYTIYNKAISNLKIYGKKEQTQSLQIKGIESNGVILETCNQKDVDLFLKNKILKTVVLIGLYLKNYCENTTKSGNSFSFHKPNFLAALNIPLPNKQQIKQFYSKTPFQGYDYNLKIK